MTVIFVFLSLAVALFLLMTCLTLFRIEMSIKLSLRITERKILKTYGRRNTGDESA